VWDYEILHVSGVGRAEFLELRDLGHRYSVEVKCRNPWKVPAKCETQCPHHQFNAAPLAVCIDLQALKDLTEVESDDSAFTKGSWNFALLRPIVDGSGVNLEKLGDLGSGLEGGA
jgi:hypothetical protein